MLYESDDILVWPCGTWAYRSELHEFTWMSDDYQTLTVGSPEYNQFNLTHCCF